MSDLSERQRTLLSVMKGRIDHSNADSAYARYLLSLPHLHSLRGVMLWWREFVISSRCPFTVAALKQQGSFKRAIREFVRCSPGTPFAEEQGRQFLDFIYNSETGLARAFAETERALIRRFDNQAGRAGYYERFSWPCDPGAFFASVLRNIPCEWHDMKGNFEVELAPLKDGIRWYEVNA